MTITVCDLCEQRIALPARAVRVSVNVGEERHSGNDVSALRDFCPDCLGLIPDLCTAVTMGGLRARRLPQELTKRMTTG